MNHIRKFSSYQSKKNPAKVVNESVLQVDDTYKVRVIVDVKKSFINSYVKKVSDNTQKNLRDFYADMDIVEELVKNVVETGMNIDSIPATLLVGGSQTQAQGQKAPQAQVQSQPQAQPQSQPQAQPEVQVQTDKSQDDFEEVQSPQGGQAETTQAQPSEEEESTENETVEDKEEELP